MNRYDALRDTWIYREIEQEIRVQEHQSQLQQYRQILQEIVTSRFPGLEGIVICTAEDITKTVVLRRLIVLLSSVPTEHEALHTLLKADDLLGED